MSLIIYLSLAQTTALRGGGVENVRRPSGTLPREPPPPPQSRFPVRVTVPAEGQAKRGPPRLLGKLLLSPSIVLLLFLIGGHKHVRLWFVSRVDPMIDSQCQTSIAIHNWQQ